MVGAGEVVTLVCSSRQIADATVGCLRSPCESKGPRVNLVPFEVLKVRLLREQGDELELW